MCFFNCAYFLEIITSVKPVLEKVGEDALAKHTHRSICEQTFLDALFIILGTQHYYKV